ncbi:MAG: bifunctional diaminohydroxyphosphoribosylaminopyrimidine deaminase/5-amino-6-(5-phosphoribosylamino)uracil reductase RibD [Tannerella sp.]|jgi:diaminohydroxyphosphoribosylaminopyrimidine deaminase/5-amino-6-(5-phosphoribosylamino)uracil reductase|nr:bifunctional diaminohydroxyphosphoribosylaminopyrimidine deaminase/5-amino-6-(5-phosphoribosylamino)uracil reductase RibD [Tannerella sp.]
MQVEEKYMVRCMELAEYGRLSVAPNPMVGAVIVHRGRIIGEGYHRRYGEAHAEVNAIASVRDVSLLHEATLYVNLEPCSHFGKTPPCTQLIIRKHIPRVVVGCLDPFPEVSGRGVKMLRDAGIDVVTNVMKHEALALNRVFITAHSQKRPYIILKWAESVDGYLDRIRTSAAQAPVQLSTAITRRFVHKLRSEVSAILVGTNTVRLDNPSLTVRHWVGASPVRVFIDRRLSVPTSYHVLDGSVPTLVFTEKKQAGGGKTEYIRIDFEDEVIPQILRSLHERRLYSLLVEGGACLHRSFLNAGLWDELQVETAPVLLGNGVKSADIHIDETCEMKRRFCVCSSSHNKLKETIITVYSRRHL